MQALARLFMLLGVIFLIIGGLIYLAGRINLPLGRLPGDIRIIRENFSCFMPVATMILLSVILTVVLNLAIRLFGKK